MGEDGEGGGAWHKAGRSWGVEEEEDGGGRVKVRRVRRCNA